MTGSDATGLLPLDVVLLGSALTFGALEVALVSLVTLGWLGFGVWSWRQCGPGSAGRLTVLNLLAWLGFVAAVLAQDALLFYAGSAVAGYACLGALLLVHGRGASGSAAVQLLLLVSGDLVLFELLVYLYAEAQSAVFTDLQAAYRAQASAVSFVWGLLVVTGGSRLAVLLLLVPGLPPTPAWRAGAAPALLCLALVSGVLPGARLLGHDLVSGEMLSSLAAMSAAALVLYSVAAACVAGRSALDAAMQSVGGIASHCVALANSGLAGLAERAQQLTPHLLAVERWIRAWPVAVAAATVLAVILAIAFRG